MKFLRFTTKLGLVGLLGLALTGTARAADLKQIYDLAVANDPQLAAAKATFMAQREVVPQARAGLLPNISAQATTTYNRQTSPTAIVNPITGNFGVSSLTQSYNSNNWSAQLSQPVFDLSRWFQFQQSKSIVAQAQDTFATAQQDLIYRVANAYLGILEAQDQLSAAIAARDAVKRQLEQVQQRYDVGLVAITDVLEATASYDLSTTNVISAQGAQSVSFEKLLTLTGQTFNQVNGLSKDFPIDYPKPRNEDAWVKGALKGNLSIAASEQAVKSAHRALEIARSGHLPTVTANVAYANSRNHAQSFLSGSTKSSQASLTVNVPIFSGLATHSQAVQASYQLETAQKNLDFSRSTVVENTRSLYSDITTDVARVQATQRGIESSQSALDATETGYKVGTRNIVDVLTAQQSLFQARFQYASARYQYIRDTLQLKQAAGSLNPEDIYSLNKYIVTAKAVKQLKPAGK